MTTYFDFNPPPNAAYEFSPTLDGQVCTAIVTWNLFGARYYLNVYAPDGSLVVSLPLIGSDAAHNIQNMSWAHGTVTVTCVAPHEWTYLNTVDLTIAGCSPDVYNGKKRALVINPTQFTFPLATNPGKPSILGAASHDVNMVAGYFSTSTLIYREANRQFEVVP